MLTLPIPMIVAVLLGFLFVQSWLKRDRPWLFSALLACCALQGVVISLAQHYGVAALRPLQPVTATIIPPLAWVTFQATAIRDADLRRDLSHLAAPAFTAFCVAFAPVVLDLAVPVVFLIYGTLILHALRPGADGLPLTRLEAGDLPGLVWRAIAVALILSAFSDGLIALAQVAGHSWLQPWIISVFSSFWLLCIGGLSLSQSLGGIEAAPLNTLPAAAPDDIQPDTELLAQLDRLLAEERLYLDPGLTLSRLAKRLHVPIKRLSATINRATGENVSRFINGFRIRRACERLEAGDNVTAAMLESGFNTKSNFNREFLRVTGSTPSTWLPKNIEPTCRLSAIVMSADGDQSLLSGDKRG
jgi:AraC-like DNA-binding protein